MDRIENTFSELERKPEEYAIEQKAASQSGLRMSSVGMDVIGLVSSIFKKRKPETRPPQTDFDIGVLKNKYHPEYLTDLLELDPAYLNEFIYFAQDNGLSLEMLKSNNELAVIELLLVEVDRFKQNSSKLDALILSI